MSGKGNHPAMNFKTMAVPDVPQGRNGKHKQIVSRILSDLDQIAEGRALKIPLANLAESKEKVRSALNRATRKAKLNVVTASDETFLYVWNERGLAWQGNGLRAASMREAKTKTREAKSKPGPGKE
jgi:hypothetical protein